MLPKALHAMALSQLLPPVIANFSGAYKKGQSLKSFCVFLLLFPRITYMVRKGFILLVAGSHHLYVSWFSLFLPTPFCILLALVATKTRQISCVLPACPFLGRDSGHEGPGALLWRRDVGKRASAKCEKTHQCTSTSSITFPRAGLWCSACLQGGDKHDSEAWTPICIAMLSELLNAPVQ